MKNLVWVALMASYTTLASVEENYYKGFTPQGETCDLSISPAKDSDYDNVIMRAKIGGGGIPTFLGFGATKFTKSFKIVRFEHDQRLVSMGSEGDPELELFENEQQELSYTLHVYPMFGGVDTYNCDDLKKIY